MRLSHMLGLASLATTAAASGASIIASMATITNTSIALNTSVATWDGGLLGTIPIVVKSTQLLVDIKNGTATANASNPLSAAEAAQVAQATTQLAGVVEDVLATIVRAKRKFDKLLLSPAILLNLELQNNATQEFSEAVVAKVPKDLQAFAKTLIEPIQNAFDAAIKKYALFSK
ncbi:hypothetical protein AK830_g12463 [Neonectria ditissima]|uniref:Antigenic cell wall galactomannoprotein n=1 Tax=Neonectria ditissima TaxID=78410 RepID=A0A0P7API9_9HYPO|nr:hypothetical protein AK830_g12463 [Neonectria ditissima]